MGPAAWQRYQALSRRDPNSPYTAYDRWVWEQLYGRQNPPTVDTSTTAGGGLPEQATQITEWDRLTYAGLTDEEIRQAKLVAAGLAPQASAAPWYTQGLGQPDYQIAQEMAAGLRMTPAEEASVTLQQDANNLAWQRFNRPYTQLDAWEKAQVEQAAQQVAFEREQWERQYTQPTAYQAASLGQQQAQAAQQMALAQQQMAFEAEQARLQREQRQREMAQQIGQAIAAMQAELYQQTLPYRLPEGTMYAPGFEPLGPVSAMYRLGGLPYTPTQIPVANPPTSKAMQDWIADAVRRFGPG